MSFSLLPLILLGVGVTLVIGFALFRLVHVELAPSAGLTGRRSWLLLAAVGVGVIVFAIKLAVMSLLMVSSYRPATPMVEPVPHDTSNASNEVDAQPSDYAFALLPASKSRGIPIQFASSAHFWRALPQTAPYPEDNPTTVEKIAIGEKLFNDKRLSRDGTVSCSSCHDLYGAAGTDGKKIAQGIDRSQGNLNTPTVWNVGFQSKLFWDGRASTLEEQVVGPLLNPHEMDMESLQEVENRVNGDSSYRREFASVFGSSRPVTIEQIADAIAAYERSLVTADTPYDQFVRGDHRALNERQIRGMALFASVGCIKCHGGPNFSAASVFDGTAPRRLFPAIPTPLESQFNWL